jgi:hypothetical protein
MFQEFWSGFKDPKGQDFILWDTTNKVSVTIMHNHETLITWL